MTFLDIMFGEFTRQNTYDRNAWEVDRERAAAQHASVRKAAAEPSGMKSIAKLLTAEDVLLALDVSTKQRLFEEVGRLFERRHGIPQKQVVESLGAREKLGSTGLGQGVALPHARVEKLAHAMAAYVRVKMPIPFDAPDGKPVSDMLVLLVPAGATEQHLQILAEFAQMLGDRQFREQIRACDDPGAACRLIGEWLPSL